jgi:hypothetical protein
MLKGDASLPFLSHANTYCMTGRAIQGNIQFEGGSIGLTTGGTIHNQRTEYVLVNAHQEGNMCLSLQPEGEVLIYHIPPQ